MQTHAISKVRRNLFGPVDHEALRKDLDAALESDNKDFCEKWNYDLKKDSPLEGKFNWEVVDTNREYVPSFYTRGYPVKVQRTVRVCDTNVKTTTGDLSSLSFGVSENDTISENHATDIVSSSGNSSSSLPSVCNIKPEKKKIVQTQISAFMPKRKRSRSEATSTVRSKAPRL